MKKTRLQVELVLPNGKDRHFSITPKTDWRTVLKSEVKDRFPRSDAVQFVEEPPRKTPTAERPFKSNVMFEIRKNYYVLGHVTARAAGK